jgi:hypothetical protein
MANDELYTPKHIFDALNLTFDLDVCAPKEGPLHTPANKWFSLEDDGLTKEWVGRVWMNPPYSNPTPWIDKWIDHKNGFALVAFSKSNWFGRLWDSKAMGVRLPTNTAFIDRQSKKQQIWMPVSLWAIGETNITALRMSGFGRIR